MFKTYYQLTKPGIIYGNDITVAAGFLLASRGHVDWVLFVATLVGISLVIASACVFNNFLDRGIDERMQRTSKRALVTGEVSPQSALVYASVLGVLGFWVLAFFTNILVIIIGFIGIIDYIVLYGITKRRSTFGTLVGSISGATPIAAGYVAASGRFDSSALILFLIMAVWQMPHFYAIAMYRLKDYSNAGIPVLPAVKGMHSAKVQIVFYTGLFVLACQALSVLGHAGNVYRGLTLAISAWWLWLGLMGFKKDTDDKRWARKMFFVSLAVMLVLSVAVAVGSTLP
ncbi:MAG TPA: heme o synthase [Bacillota bacterium]|nr:heme o synthase [Bacillota bacterium]